MHQIFPKVNQVFSYHLKNFQVINSLMASVSSRVDAEEQYQKAINKSAQTISQLHSQHPLYSKIIFSFKSVINERANQIRFFKQQILREAELLRSALIPIEQSMKSHLSELKNMEKDLKSSFDTLTKNKNVAEQKFKELDEKFVLNQISVLYKQNIGLRKNSEALLGEQLNISKLLQKDWEMVHLGVSNFESGAQQRQKKIWQLDVKVEEEFVDFFKKLNVHQISLIRNIQYDIDTMIKKTDIFNWQNTNQFKDQFSGKAIEQLKLSITDPYIDFKKSLISQQQIIDPKPNPNCNVQKLAVLKQRLKGKKEAEELLGEIKKNYPEFRTEVCEWIESFRKVGVFKFESQEFSLIVYIFRQVLRCALSFLDFQCVQRIILYGNSYFSIIEANNRQKTVLDQIKNEKILSDLGFWKFYLLWTVRQNIGRCNATEQRSIHLRNGVYSTLLSNSLAMIDWGIEKHSIKNLIGKLAKTFGSLTEAQVSQLIKVIETAHQNNQKGKKPKKE